MIDNLFLNVKFTEITLLHILILLGYPYIIFYFFEKLIPFDKFPEKWELGLFVFVIGGSITLISLFLQRVMDTNFIIIYIILSSIFFLGLIIYVITKKSNPNKNNNIGWIKVELKNGELYTGVYTFHNQFELQLSAGKRDKIQREVNHIREDVKAKVITFNRNEILAIFYY